MKSDVIPCGQSKMNKLPILCAGLLIAIGVSAIIRSTGGMTASLWKLIWTDVWFSPTGMVNRTLPFAGALIASAYLYHGKRRSNSLAIGVLLAIIANSIYNIVSARPRVFAIAQAVDPVFILSVATLTLLFLSILAQKEEPNKPVDATAKSPVVEPTSTAPTHHL